jgi:hypothetical protein
MFARNRWTSCAALFTALALLAGVRSISAQGKKAEEPEGTPQEIQASNEKNSAAERLNTAIFLIDFARTNKSPTALLAAVELIHRTPTKEGEEGDKNAPGEKSLADQISDLLSEAKKMRPDDKEVAALSDRLSQMVKERSRDVVGPVVNFNRILDPLDQFTTQTYTFQAVGGQITVRSLGVPRLIRIERLDPTNNRVLETHQARIGTGTANLRDFFSVPNNQTRRFKFRISNLTTVRDRIFVTII